MKCPRCHTGEVLRSYDELLCLCGWSYEPDRVWDKVEEFERAKRLPDGAGRRPRYAPSKERSLV